METNPQRIAVRAGITMKFDVDSRKPGKGRPDINSSIFLDDMAMFISLHIVELRRILRLAMTIPHVYSTKKWLLNIANAHFMMCDIQGMQIVNNSVQSVHWLMASWCIMMAAELDNIQVDGWDSDERCALTEKLLHEYDILAQCKQEVGDAFHGISMQPRAMHLIPRMALVRLGIHQELCMVHTGLKEAAAWKFEGLRSVAARMGSAKRHFDAALWGRKDEDHIIHLLWNMMAIYHTCWAFPAKNDCQASDGGKWKDSEALGALGWKILKSML